MYIKGELEATHPRDQIIIYFIKKSNSKKQTGI